MTESVEMLLTESALDDAAQAQEEPTTLETLTEEPAPEQVQPQENDPPAKEPGWIKNRINKAVTKAVAEARAEVRAEYEAMLAPMREEMYDRQAQALVQSGEFKSLERAKEYVRLKNGQPAPAAPAAPAQEPAKLTPRDERGRFQGRTSESENRARANLLAQQADKIQARRGLDVMGAFNGNTEIRNRVLSGEWDFYDVADYLAENPQATRKAVPAPVRSANGAGSAAGLSIANMTDEQFERLERNLSRGVRYDLSK